MPKIPECDRCQLNPHNSFIVCAVHPTGPNSDRCLDFRPAAELEELWVPEGTRFADGELVLGQPTYDGRPVAIIPRQRFTPESKLELLDHTQCLQTDVPACLQTDVPAVRYPLR